MAKFNRREFLKTSATGVFLGGFAGNLLSCSHSSQNGIYPSGLWRGFNILDFFSPKRFTSNLLKQTEQDFKLMSDWGFNFVRIPMTYPGYIEFDTSLGRNITPEETVKFNEEAVQAVEQTVFLANKYGLHVSLNIHRAPGFCINAGFHEPFNLWTDEEAQKAFYAHWDMWAKRFRNVSSEMLSFDLVNEPCFKSDMNDQFCPSTPVDGLVYRKIVMECLKVIHNQTPDRQVVADGNHGGSLVIPEITDLPVMQSCRGYYPHYVSHYKAGWVWKNPEDSPKVEWPGTINGEGFNRSSLEDFYAPWIALAKKGVKVHCGECGCYNRTPHPVFLRWFEDQLDILTSNGIGWGLWNFRGDFGILDSGRDDVFYEDFHGHKLDRNLLTLLQKY